MKAPARATAALLLSLLAGCVAPRPPLPTPQLIPEPDPAEVERVIFLVGDAGEARSETHPILPRLQRDIEGWAQRLATDSAVSLLFLGDIVYPYGLHPPGHELFPHDSAIVMDQVRLVAGPFAREHSAQAYFLAGNHDWGLEEEWEGFVRLNNLDLFLVLAREETGASASLVPAAGTGGPYVLDMGPHVRLLMLDTAWWLLRGGDYVESEHARVLHGIRSAMESAGDREVLLAAHHPFTSEGPHGGEFSFWETLGIRYVLARSGAILQDLTSLPYRELEIGLREIFADTGPPLAFLGGHEHSLQVIGGIEPTDPEFNVVSGSASKLSGLVAGPGMTFGASLPGYMRLMVEKDGGIVLTVEAAPAEFQSCPADDPARAECMAEGVAAFRTIHSQRLR